MESKVNYTVVGLFVIGLTAALIFLVVWLAGKSDNKRYTMYLVLMKESVSGLNDNAPVKYNGVTVGNIESISLNSQNPNEVRLLLAIQEGTPIKVDTRAMLMSQGLTGLSFVNLSGGSPQTPFLKVKPGEKYPIIKTEPSLMFRLDTTVKELSISLTALSREMRNMLSKENQLTIRQTLQNIDRISSALANNAKKIEESVQSTHAILKNVEQASQRFPMLVNNLADTSVRAKQISQELNDQTLPQLFQTLHILQGASGQFNDLAIDLRQNPSLLIRGRQPLIPGPGEENK